MDIRFEKWNVRSLHRRGSLKPAARKLGKYKLKLHRCTKVQMGEGSHRMGR
jgi:hypothetical protein